MGHQSVCRREPCGVRAPGGDRAGALGKIARYSALSDAATLFMGLTVKASSRTQCASPAMAELFDAGANSPAPLGPRAADNANMWIGNDLRDSMAWAGFEEVVRTALDALDEATKNLALLVETVAEEKPDLVTDVADGQRRMRELRDGLRLILDGRADDRYVYSCQVNRRLASGR